MFNKKNKFMNDVLGGLYLSLVTWGKSPNDFKNSDYNYLKRIKKRSEFKGKVADVKRGNLSVAQPLMDIYDSMNAIFDVNEDKANHSVGVSYIHDVSDKVVDRGAELIKSSYKSMEESMHNLIGVDISSLDSEVQSKIKVARNMLDGRHEARLPTPNDGSMNKYVRKFADLYKNTSYAMIIFKNQFDIKDEPFIYQLPTTIDGKFNPDYDGSKGLMIIPDNFEELLEDNPIKKLDKALSTYLRVNYNLPVYGHFVHDLKRAFNQSMFDWQTFNKIEHPNDYLIYKSPSVNDLSSHKKTHILNKPDEK